MDKVLKHGPALPWMQPAHDAFPYGTKKNGECEMLQGTKCLVYEDRPLLCDIERISDELDTGMTQQEWFDMNYKGCEQLQQLQKQQQFRVEIR
jgi:Fe-S-cluster containining protein